ncbi:MAG: hypothetical protein IT561_04195 [Alphaproteobacteria bacterium]|nr:hypothetical protein [Alphaproteobacteria bacterium]
MTAPSDDARRDRFGNPIDPKVGYARGRIITGEVDEVRRQAHAHAIMRDRFVRHGDAGVFNLTGLIRGYPLADGDSEALQSYVHYNARRGDELEQAALARMGGDPARHSGFLANRVTSGVLAVMVTLLQRGDRVLSIVADDRSHPSIKQAVDMAGGQFDEAVGIDAFAEAIAHGPRPAMVTVTAISPSKRHLPAPDALRAIALARAAGALVMIDDAHMAARISLYDEPPGLLLGDPDIAVWSLDKHVIGPRSGFVAGRSELITRIKARALSLGVEAQIGPQLSGLRAIEAFDPAPIRAARDMAGRILDAIQPEMDGRAYMAGAGVAVGGEDFLEIARRRANDTSSTIVPIEAMAFTAMVILERFGGVTIPASGMPGSACTFRLMTYPDGARMGEETIAAAARTAMQSLVAALNDPETVRRTILGG